jgi:4-hydroxythreonine-4-phosphate dehydrogenase
LALRPETFDFSRPLVVGDVAALTRTASQLGVATEIRRLERVAEAEFRLGGIDCMSLDLIPDDLPLGQLSAATGEASYRFIEKAVALAMAGKADAICTAPPTSAALSRRIREAASLAA